MYLYTGNEYYIGFVPHFGNTPLIIMLTSSEKFTYYSIEAPVTKLHQGEKVTANVANIVTLPSSLTGISRYSYTAESYPYKEGVHLQTTGDDIFVIGLSEGQDTFDTFFAIPVKELCVNKYTYFAISVDAHVRADGSVVIVGTANKTIVNITVPVSAVIKLSNSVDWLSLQSGTLYSFEIQRLQIAYIAVLTTDLTGTKVTSNKPISLFSGHECAFVPSTTLSCDLVMEHIPPTVLWGSVYYFAPLANRTSYTIKIIAAYDSTVVQVYCNSTVKEYKIDTGGFITDTYHNQEFCGIYANNNVLVGQFSHGYQSDSRGDPMMTLIPATVHYTNTITSTTFQMSTHKKYSYMYNHYINIVALASYYQPEMISVTYGGKLTHTLDSQNWVPIIRNNVTEAYATQLKIPHGVFEVTHLNSSALITVVVYGFAVRVGAVRGNIADGYGHPGWLKPILNG